MEQQVTAKATLQAFCQAWFEERNLNGALGYLTEDVEFIGTGDEEEASGIEEMSLYIRQDIDEMPEPFCSRYYTCANRYWRTMSIICLRNSA